MALQIRRTSESFISTSTFANGEPVYSTDTHKLFIGDGVTPGGFQIGVGGGGSLDFGFITAPAGFTLDLGSF